MMCYAGIKIDGCLENSYKNKDAVREVDYTFIRQMVYGLLGENGAGKNYRCG